MQKFYTETPFSAIVQRARWYATIRFFFLTAIAVPGVLSLLVADGWTDASRRALLLAAVAIASNVIFYLLAVNKTQKISYFKILASTFLIIDVLLVSLLIFINGGIESRSPILYILPMLLAAAIFGRAGLFLTAFGAAGLYSGIIIADYLQLINSIGAYNPELRLDLPYVINTVVFFPSIFIVTAFIIDFITKMLIKNRKQLQDSLEALDRAQKIAKLGSWELALPHNSIRLSDELFSILGIKSKEEKFTLQQFLRIVHPEDKKKLNQTITKAIKKKNEFTTDYRIILPDGFIKYIHTEGRPDVNNRGKVIKLFGTAQDVTEAKQIDDTKQEFISLASHQLRTPATAVKQYLGLILGGYSGKITADQKAFLEKAYEGNERQIKIVNDLLNVAVADAGRIKLNKVKFDIVQLINEVIEDQRQKIKNRRQSIIFQPKRKKVYAFIDPHRIRMVIENLIDNASKYSPTGSDKKIYVIVSMKGKDIIIEVQDEGVGIEKEQITKLFSKFSRIDNPLSVSVGGSGLGLYWAQQIVELHKGKISVDSAPNRGTVFSVQLPAGDVV